MIRLKKNFISLMISITMLSGMLVLNPVNVDASVDAVSEINTSGKTNEYGLANDTSKGTILHAFSWSFNTIRERIKEIAECGYSAIQVLPISKCYQNSDGSHTWEWENTYQPTDFTIGNYVVGSKDEFIALNKEAEKYGIKIIVDIVANHLANDYTQINPILWNDQSLFHNKGGIYDDWSSRYSVTQKDLLGLHDLNTHSEKVQNLVKGFIKDCIDCGADGFRFDKANYIELPDDYGFKGNFWPNIVGAIKEYKPDAFIYGEVLQDYESSHVSRYSAYAKYLRLTADYYGDEIRKEVNEKNLCGLFDYKSEGVSPDKLVTYSETHDTYAGNGKSFGDNEWKIRKGYEIVAARAQGTPLFLARPKNTGRNNEGKLDGPLGVPQNDWNNAEVKEVNKFHNAMIGEGEYIRYLNNKTIAIERGNKGVVIVNLDGGYSGIIPTKLANGIYKDQTTGKSVSVINGQMNIDVKSGMTAVIYKNDEAFISATPNSTTYSSDTLEITLLAKNVTSARYVVDGVDKGSFIDNTKVIIGEGKNIGDTTKLTLTAKDEDGKDIEKTYTYTKGKNRNIVYIKLPSGWGEPYAYVYDDSTGTVKNNAAWPGVKMTKVGDNLYSYEVDSSIANPKVIFTDNKIQYPASGQSGLTLNGSMIYSDGQWQVYNSNRTYPVIQGSNVAVIELPSGWGEPYAYVYDDSTGTVKNNAAWPGVKMTKVRENLYAYEVLEGYTNPKVLFTDNKIQYPKSGQAGLELKGQMIYSDGKWSNYRNK